MNGGSDGGGSGIVMGDLVRVEVTTREISAFTFDSHSREV